MGRFYKDKKVHFGKYKDELYYFQGIATMSDENISRAEKQVIKKKVKYDSRF